MTLTMGRETAATTAPAARNAPVLVAFTAITNLADGVLRVALPLLAVGLTGSPAQVAAVGFALTLPWLLVALHVGVLVDRVDRRRLLSIANTIRLGAVGALLLTLATDTVAMPVLLGAALVVGVTDVIASTSLSAIVPSAVRPAQLTRTNAWVTGAETVTNEFAGPALGGLLVGLGAAVSLGATAVAYGIGILLTLLLVGGFKAVRTTRAPARGSVNADIREGLRFLRRNRLLWTMTVTISVLIISWSAWLALLPTFATGELHLSGAAYGLLISTIGAGGLAGVFLAEPLNKLLGRRNTLFADLVGTLVMVAIPAIFPHPVLIGVAGFAGGLGGTLWTVTSRTISQQLVPQEMYGRYSATARLISWGTLPLGAGLAGVLAEFVGVRWTFAVLALIVVATFVPFLRNVTEKKLPPEPETD
ncbi:MFS transporter [Phytomonospora endophytica]|uniref:MFS family permease n=1 Tax=Phytomonospora endophytica TaxID=714109 RepID=A0A841FSX2_9ACTN|nr:MFS transporter [Phytomonospora endophytica]MBB6038904.1 MFS family permease [Phytomonospora endophytica]GIG71569.1 MFS transporter [Phytomonospora endophytica]